MNQILKLNNKTINLFAISEKKNGCAAFPYGEGSVISARVASKTETRLGLITNEGTEFSINSLGNFDIGDELYFKVINSDSGTPALRQLDVPVRESNRASAQHQAKNTGRLMRESNFASSEGDILADKSETEKLAEEERKEELAIAKIRRELAFASDNVNRDAMRELIKSGVSLERISLGVLNSVAGEVVRRYKIESPSKNDKPSLSPTRTEKLKSCVNISNNGIISLLRSGNEPTVGNVYRAVNSGQTEVERLDADTLDSLLPEIERALAAMGFDVEKTIECAKEIVGVGIPLNEKNIRNYLIIKSLKNIDFDDIQDFVSGRLQDGKFFSEISFADMDDESARTALRESYAGTVRALPNMRGEHIDFLLGRSIPVTLGNIKDAVNSGAEISAAKQTTLEAADLKKQLIEIQLKLDFDNIGILISRKININTLSLQKALDEINTSNDERYAGFLNEAGFSAEASENDGVKKMSRLFDMLGRLKAIPKDSYIVPPAENTSIADYDRLMSAYGSNVTQISGKHGDSYAKAEADIAGLLNTLGIAITPENIRAAVILSRNNMDIDEDSVFSVKSAAAKLDKIIDYLHPRIAADMIGEGCNPLDMSIDEIIAFIDKYNGQFGGDLKDKVAENIHEMCKNKTLNKDERCIVTAVYRLINQISKNGLASVGAVLNAEKELTFGNLLDASKYFEKSLGRENIFDKMISENTLRTESVSENGIAETLNEAAAIFRYNDMQVRRFGGLINTDILKKLISDDENRQLAIDETNRLIENLVLDNIGIPAAEIIPDAAPDILRLMRHFGVEINRNGVEAMKLLSPGRNSLTKLLTVVRESLEKEDASLALSEFDKLFAELSADGIRGAANGDMTEIADSVIDILIDDADSKNGSLTEVLRIRPALELAGRVNRSKSLLMLPVKFNSGYAEINMYIRNGTVLSMEGNIFFSLDAGRLGVISAAVEYSDSSIDAAVICGSRNAREALLKQENIFKALIEEHGYAKITMNIIASANEQSTGEIEKSKRKPQQRFEQQDSDLGITDENQLPENIVKLAEAMMKYLEATEMSLINTDV